MMTMMVLTMVATRIAVIVSSYCLSSTGDVRRRAGPGSPRPVQLSTASCEQSAAQHDRPRACCAPPSFVVALLAYRRLQRTSGRLVRPERLAPSPRRPTPITHRLIITSRTYWEITEYINTNITAAAIIVGNNLIKYQTKDRCTHFPDAPWRIM